MPVATTDRNLLFGVLALQADFLDAGQFAEACSAWAARKDTPLPDLLIERGWLTAEDKAHVDYLLERKVQKHAGDVQASLAAVADNGIKQVLAGLEDPAFEYALTVLPPPGPALVAPIYPTETRERYGLSRLHGKGGIGQVWLARDHDLGRDVALKELRPHLAQEDAVAARFLEEAKITGQLEHPGIVPVYELARRAADQKPFYTMRFIKGRTLTEAIQTYHQDRVANRATPLQLRELLGAFIAVCNAVAYAHSRGVIHRDLKGQNVVVGSFGEVIVLDWGLAKVLGQKEDQTSLLPVSLEKNGSRDETRQGQVVGTPGYMPPEQAKGRWDRVDKRSDVYGLGAILYEVLTGEPPFTGSNIGEVLQKVMEEVPVPPRQKVATTSQALEAVCLKALAKRPEDRYLSASELAQEVQRWLADEPVGAYRESWTERTGRWMKRHRTGVTAGVAAAGVAVVCLATATVLLAAANQRERQAKDEATGQRDEARRQKDLAEAAQQREREAKEEATRQSDEARKQKDRADQNLARARKAVEDYCTNVAEDKRLKQADFHDLRKKLLETAVPFYQEFLKQKGDDPQLQADQGRALGKLGLLQAEIGETAQAIADYRQMRVVFTELAQAHPGLPDYRRDLSQSHNDLGVLLSTLGQWQEAEAEYRQALALRDKLAKAFPTVPDYRRDLAASHSNLGVLLHDLGRRQEAEAEYRQALTVRDKLVKNFPTVPDYRQELARSHTSLGLMLSDLGQWQGAEAELHQALALKEKLAQDFPTVSDYRWEMAISHYNLGNLLMGQGQWQGAEAEYRQALAVQDKLVKNFPTVPDYRKDLARSHNNLGVVVGALGRPQEAEAEYRQALALKEKLAQDFPAVPTYRKDLAASHYGLGSYLRGQGHWQEAEAECRQALTLREKLAQDFPAVPDYRKDLAASHCLLGIVLSGLGRRPEAQAEYRQALVLEEKLAQDFPTVPDYRRDLALSHNNLGFLLSDLGRRPEAQAEYRQALVLEEKLVQDFPAVPGYAVELARSANNLGNLLRQNGQPGEALELFTKAAKTLADGLAKNGGPGEAQNLLRQVRMNRAMALAATGKPTEAVAEATTLAEGKDATALTFFNASCVMAVASAGAKDDAKPIQQYAAQAVDLLAKAREAGYFKDPANVEHLKKHPDLDPLRSRDDFKKFLQEVEGHK